MDYLFPNDRIQDLKFFEIRYSATRKDMTVVTSIYACNYRFVYSNVPKVVDLDDNIQCVFDLFGEVGPVWFLLPHRGYNRKTVPPAVD